MSHKGQLASRAHCSNGSARHQIAATSHAFFKLLGTFAVGWRTKAKSPQTNGIVERFHKTMLDEFYRIAFRKKVYATIDELQADLDAWIKEFNELRPHQGKWCFGKTPMQTFIDALPLAREKSGQLQAIEETHAA